MSQEERSKGKVKFYNEKRGFGFIVREDKRGDIFFHYSNLEDSEHNPQQNDFVEFEIAPGRAGKKKAIKVRKID